MRNNKRHLAKLRAQLPDLPISEEVLRENFRADFAAVRAAIAKHGPLAKVDDMSHPVCVSLAAFPRYQKTHPSVVCFLASYYLRLLANGAHGEKTIAKLCGEPEPNTPEPVHATEKQPKTEKV